VEAEAEGRRVPIVFGDASAGERLTHWGLLSEVSLDGEETHYRFEGLRPISGRAISDLQLLREGRAISREFLRSYALCATPAFLYDGWTIPHEEDPDAEAAAIEAQLARWPDGAEHPTGDASLGDDEVASLDEELSAALEGEVRARLARHRSRERRLRDAKVQEVLRRDGGRLRCEVPGCGFDFEAVYGQLGAGYAQVHHLEPLAERDVASVTALEDLAIVCANCHAMVHRGGGCRPIHDLIASSDCVTAGSRVR
jgi:hypothetical protein